MPTPMIDGDASSPILIVGMAPGAQELSEGRPFVGPSGNLLWGAAKRAGFSRADCLILNTIGELPAASEPTPEQLDRYWDAFDQAVANSRATVALCLGKTAFWRLTGVSGSITDWRGYLVPVGEWGQLVRHHTLHTVYKSSGKTHKKGDPRVVRQKVTVDPVVPANLQLAIPTFHPSYIMRLGFKPVPALMYDVARAGRALHGTLATSTVQYLTLPAPLDPTRPVSFDIETIQTVPGLDSIVRIALSDGQTTWTAPWSLEVRELVRHELSLPNRVKIAHNAAFDLERLEDAEVHVEPPVYDTMLAAQMLQPDLFKGLNSVASLYLDTWRWKHKSESDPEMYNAMDALREWELWQVTALALQKSNQLSLFQDTVMRAVPTLMHISKRGLRVSTATQHRLRTELQARERAAVEVWTRHYPDVNPASNQQLKSLLYKTLGIPAVRGHDGKPTVDEAALTRLVRTAAHPEPLQAVLEMRDAHKARSAFVDLRLRLPSNTVHPTYLPRSKDDDDDQKGMAGTGRIQAKDPNIQQVPKSIRRMYIPHRSDDDFLEADFDQAELRVVAGLSADRRLLTAINGPDLHSRHARSWGCTRSDAKAVTYGTIYGAGPAGIQRALATRGVHKTQKQCEALQEAFFSDYPQIKAWRADLAAQVKANRYLTNPFGRRRYFWSLDRDMPAAFDFLPQSTVADIVWRLLPELESLADRLGGALTTTVHDSFLLEFPRAILPTAAPAVKQILEQEFHMVAPGFYLPVSIKIGPTWGDLGEEQDELSTTLTA